MFTNLKNKCLASMGAFHNEEDGVEAIQAVVILAVGAIAMIVVKTKWNDIKGFFDKNIDASKDGWQGAA